MLLLHFTRILCITTIVFSLNLHAMDPDIVCNKIVRSPYFEVEMVLGDNWTVYHTWGMNLTNKCLEMSFGRTTPAIVSTFQSEMMEYLESQPYWEGAMLVVVVGVAGHTMMLFADQGPAGSFIGVVHSIREDVAPKKNEVPVSKIRMKFLNHGNLLLMSDCRLGITTLSARAGTRMAMRTEIQAAVKALEIGAGHSTCLDNEINDDDNDLLDEHK